MKYMTFENGGTVTGLVTVNGLTMTGPLKLLSDPTEPNHAVNKEYVDNAVTVLNASYIASGTLSVQRFPGMTGDVVSVAGSGVILLKNTGVVPGTHCKVTVASTGLITKGETLSVSDIPNLSFNKITTNKPTTLAGYGITDGVSRNGGVINGNLTLVGDPVAPTDLVTKQYADLSLAGRTGYAVGDIIRYSGNLTPSGFLKCNGGEVSKATYPDLYSVIGNTFNYDTLGYGKPWSNQYGFESSTTAPTGTGYIPPELPFEISVGDAVVTKNRVYLFYGQSKPEAGNASGDPNLHLTSGIDSSGNLTGWSTQQIPVSAESRGGRCRAAVYRNKVYVFKEKLYVGTIQSNGTISNWVIDTIVSNQAFALSSGSVNIYKNIMYIGSTYWFRIKDNGGLEGPFSISKTGLPTGFNRQQTFMIKDILYYIYRTSYSDASTGVIATNRLNSDGTPGIWKYTTTDLEYIDESHVFIRNNDIHIHNKRATINPDGTISNFTNSNLTLGEVFFRVAGKLYHKTPTLGYQFYALALPGGTSDYSSYNDGTAGDLLRPNTFILPDFKTDGTSYQYYIKY